MVYLYSKAYFCLYFIYFGREYFCKRFFYGSLSPLLFFFLKLIFDFCTTFLKEPQRTKVALPFVKNQVLILCFTCVWVTKMCCGPMSSPGIKPSTNSVWLQVQAATLFPVEYQEFSICYIHGRQVFKEQSVLFSSCYLNLFT